MRYGQLAAESTAYRTARTALLEAEMALRDQCERVAQLRRRLPLDTPIDDYTFHEGPADLDADGPATPVRLSGLFADPARPLVVYQFMYGGAQQTPCPMCSMWIDGFNGVGRHLPRTMNLAVIAAAPLPALRRWGRARGWDHLRLVSSDGTTFKRDLQFETADGSQLPGLSVFVRADRGALCHAYSQCAVMGENEYRGLDLYTPVWNLLDLTPGGRPDWMPANDPEDLKAAGIT